MTGEPRYDQSEVEELIQDLRAEIRAELDKLKERSREMEETFTEMSGLVERTEAPLGIKVRKKVVGVFKFSDAMMTSQEGKLRWVVTVSTAIVSSMFTLIGTIIYNYLSGHQGPAK